MSLDDIKSRVYEDENGCWIWTGATAAGYGRMRVPGRRMESVHRVTYAMANGPIPNGLFVCHKCDVRRCVNPDHLFIGTQADNMRDAARKGRLGHAPIGPPKVPSSLKKQIETMCRHMSYREVARRLGIARSTLQDFVKANGLGERSLGRYSKSFR